MADLFSILASLFACASMALYFRHVVAGAATPNPATWLIWLVIGSINATTYFLVVDGNWLRTLTLILVTGGIFCITLFALVRGKFAKLSAADVLCLALAVSVGVLWRVSGDPVIANLLLQVVYLISFAPTVLGLRRGDLQEEALPWVLAFCGYVFMIGAILLTWTPGSWVALAHPIANGLVGNGLIAYYALRGEGQRTSVARRRRVSLQLGTPV